MRAFIVGCAGDRCAASARDRALVQRTWRARTRARLGVWSPALLPHPLITRSHPSPPRGSGVWNGCDAEVGWRVVAILEGMYRSAKEGKRVHVRARKGE